MEDRVKIEIILEKVVTIFHEHRQGILCVQKIPQTNSTEKFTEKENLVDKIKEEEEEDIFAEMGEYEFQPVVFKPIPGSNELPSVDSQVIASSAPLKEVSDIISELKHRPDFHMAKSSEYDQYFP